MLLLSCLQTAAAVAAQATRVAAVAARVTDSWLSGLLRTSAGSAARVTTGGGNYRHGGGTRYYCRRRGVATAVI